MVYKAPYGTMYVDLALEWKNMEKNKGKILDISTFIFDAAMLILAR